MYYNVLRSQEVVEDLLDLWKGLAKAICVNYVTKFSRGHVAVHQHGEPYSAIIGNLSHASTTISTSTTSEVNPRIKAPTTAHQALPLGC